ncbi:N-acetylmuramoyl-L-alanine amidase [Chryseobacterium sp. JM1]|uniref:N-acetylmuramoyl-L-alanine amidase n=1 Tax=Chryseobacterium sp. JM1 TaxID=1233950 RepID=UPI0006911FCC|nr:N-acetylmuramoyl-L-alanine amidase [Chryseobacterium sp. JM1]
MKTGIIVIDPGHGGMGNVGGSDGNHAVSALGDLEKNLTLEIGLLLNAELKSKSHQVYLTRDTDRNLSLKDRANLALTMQADVFLSLHFNGWTDATTQGTETFIYPGADSNSSLLASSVQQRLVQTTKYKDRGVKELQLGVLNPAYHFPKTARALAEISFITETKDAQRLRDADYKKSLAKSLAVAIDDFINKQSSIKKIKALPVNSSGILKMEDSDI